MLSGFKAVVSGTAVIFVVRACRGSGLQKHDRVRSQAETCRDFGGYDDNDLGFILCDEPSPVSIISPFLHTH